MKGTGGTAAGWAFAILAIAAPLHLYKQLRRACDLSRFAALWRFAALVVLGAL